MNKKVASIARITPIEAAYALWNAIDATAVATEAAVRPAAGADPVAHGPHQQQAFRNLAAAVHHMKAAFAKATGWYPVSIFVDGLQIGVAREKISQSALDELLRGAMHFDVMIEAFTFQHAELQEQAAAQAYEELLAAEPRIGLLGDWSEPVLRHACAEALARLYGSTTVLELLKS